MDLIRHNHKFNYDPKERIKRQNPSLILNNIGLKNGMNFIDLGSNDGFFSIEAAKIVNQTGKVIALDIDADALTRLKKC